jgi:hypothetical protein
MDHLRDHTYKSGSLTPDIPQFIDAEPISIRISQSPSSKMYLKSYQFLAFALAIKLSTAYVYCPFHETDHCPGESSIDFDVDNSGCFKANGASMSCHGAF